MKIAVVLFIAIAIKLLLIEVAYVLPINILDNLGVPATGYTALISYAPEVWLALLALVFGTLIIVVSIASENTPKLVDMYIGDPLGRLYLWLIMLSSLENIYLQIVSSEPGMFFSNIIFINNYVLLPCSVLLAIPYTFYILKYTKDTNVIAYIYRENIQTIKHSHKKSSPIIEKNQTTLFATVNQLHDLLQFTQFKEPKGDIISGLGNSIRIYIRLKKKFPEKFFKLTENLKADISFRTMRDKYAQMQQEKVFYELKVFKVIDAIYLLLIRESHYELASVCGNELLEIGRTAIRYNDKPVVNEVIFQFNTLLRYGINHALKTREIRNAYNIIYYYSLLIETFIEQKEEDRIISCCQYLGTYANELVNQSKTEPLFNFLVDAISWELKNSLELLREHPFSKELQSKVLSSVTRLKVEKNQTSSTSAASRDGLRLIKESLCLYYVKNGEYAFVDKLLDSIFSQMNEVNAAIIKQAIGRDCELLQNETEEFWEDTDQGNRNIYYSKDKDQIPKFIDYFHTKL